MKVAILSVVAVVLVSGCGLVRTERSAEELSSSKQAYEQCVRGAEKVEQCEREKAVYDADLAEYEARHKALARYGASRVTVNNGHGYYGY